MEPHALFGTKYLGSQPNSYGGIGNPNEWGDFPNQPSNNWLELKVGWLQLGPTKMN
jgi:hypothetical protein